MSKRLFIPLMVMLLLVITSVAYAQEAPTLTEEQINKAFTIPSTATRTISNLKVVVHEDGVHISFDMTVTRDGTSNTLNIIGILIGLQLNQLTLENPMVSSFQATRSQRSEVTDLVERAWNNYMESVFGDSPTNLILAEGLIMKDGQICDPIRHIGC